jgi:hypothetical protein
LLRSANIKEQTKQHKIMNIEIKQLSNGWLVVVSVVGKGTSALYCKTFVEVLKEIDDMEKRVNDSAPSTN